MPNIDAKRPERVPVEQVIRHDNAVNIRKLFKMIDEDKNGTIETGELQQALTLAFPEKTFSDYACQTFLLAIDHNGSGLIEYHEFYQLLKHLQMWVSVFKHFKSSFVKKYETSNDIFSSYSVQ